MKVRNLKRIKPLPMALGRSTTEWVRREYSGEYTKEARRLIRLRNFWRNRTVSVRERRIPRKYPDGVWFADTRPVHGKKRRIMR